MTRPTDRGRGGSGGGFDELIPQPASVSTGEGAFTVHDTTAVVLESDVGAGAAGLLRGYVTAGTGSALANVTESVEPGRPAIVFTSRGADGVGAEGYELRITPERVDVVAAGAAGFGWAVQTFRQLLAPAREASPPAGSDEVPRLPVGTVRDAPRFPWRGVMIDVARHFFPPAEVERVVDLLAAYKLNRLHLHLTDDQGWRIEIERYPELTAVGAATAVGGGTAGHYTRTEYRHLVDFAARRGVVVVPEIDMPGHTNAALASLPVLNCDDVVPEPYTGVKVGFSSLCVEREETFQFVADVVAEVAALTPGPYFHIGGDESHATDAAGYRRFVERAIRIVREHGKTPVGWEEIATVPLGGNAIVQHWLSPDHAVAAAQQGAQIVMSPAGRTYLDQKYEESTPTGVTWAGLVDTRTAYEWDPATQVPGVPAAALLGVEAPLWTETIATRSELEERLLPRVPGYAEIGWSPATGRSWDEYRRRLARHPPRWRAAGHAFTRDPAVPWEPA